MNVQFIQSWRGALLIAAIVTIGVSGYKAVFGLDTATRIAQARMSHLLPGGQPTQEMFSRQVAAATPFVGVRMTLGQLTKYMHSLNYDIAWEAVDIDVFILRASGVDALTNQPFEFAIQFIALAGPTKDGRVIGVFNGPAVGIESMAYNRETVSEQDIADWIVSIFPEVMSVTNR